MKNTWLRVTLEASERTGLPAPDVFYFGNLVGEAGDGGAARLPSAGAIDFALTRANVGISNPAAIGRPRVGRC